MTRGPLPKKAINKAQDIAVGRGKVLGAEEMKESHFDFTIFGSFCTVYVRVKRIRSHIVSPQEIAGMFDEDVHMIRRVPLTPVVAREIWTLSPWDCWQYFLVLDDRIIEIHRDGTPVVPAGPAAEKRPSVMSPAIAMTGNAPVTTGVPATSPGTGITSASPAGTQG
jgi:hypothetical protein